MNDLISEARELSSKATPGPWMACLGSGFNVCTGIKHDSEEHGAIFIADCLPGHALDTAEGDHRPNMNFIIRSRTLVPELADALEKAEAELAAYKAANPPRVHGEWIYYKYEVDYPYECSVCGNSVHNYGYDFCPACGADMRKEK